MTTLIYRKVESPYDVIRDWFNMVNLVPQFFECEIEQFLDQLTEDRHQFDDRIRLSNKIRKIVDSNPIYPKFTVDKIAILVTDEELEFDRLGAPNNNKLLFHVSHWKLNFFESKFVTISMKFCVPPTSTFF